jgi:hypothetical protein
MPACFSEQGGSQRRGGVLRCKGPGDSMARGRDNSRGLYPILLVAAVQAARCGFKGHGSSPHVGGQFAADLRLPRLG